MTSTEYLALTQTASVRLVSSHGGGLFVQSMTQLQLAELAELAGKALGIAPVSQPDVSPWLGEVLDNAQTELKKAPWWVRDLMWATRDRSSLP